MQYRYDKEKNPVSMLAYGCMRFTKENGLTFCMIY